MTCLVTRTKTYHREKKCREKTQKLILDRYLGLNYVSRRIKKYAIVDVVIPSLCIRSISNLTWFSKLLTQGNKWKHMATRNRTVCPRSYVQNSTSYDKTRCSDACWILSEMSHDKLDSILPEVHGHGRFIARVLNNLVDKLIENKSPPSSLSSLYSHITCSHLNRNLFSVCR